jgi:hypothetical protein
LVLSLGRIFTALLLTSGFSAVQARTLEVGPGKAYAQPSGAAAAARAGDRVVIARGEYFDCAVWPQSNLVIEGDAGGGTVITDQTCQGKALFVIPGNDVTVRNLTLTRARVPDGNGAGIRAEGRNLLVEHVRFVNNQDGLMAIDQPQSTVRVEHCVFEANGVPGEERPTAALIAGQVDRLVVYGTRFEPGRGGAVVRSSARATEITEASFCCRRLPVASPCRWTAGWSSRTARSRPVRCQAGAVPRSSRFRRRSRTPRSCSGATASRTTAPCC